MNPKAQKFVESKEVALFGASARRKKFGNAILKELMKRGYDVYPMHLTAEKIDGIRTYRTINELPETVAAACVCMKPNNVAGIIEKLVDSRIQNIWFQQGADFSKYVKRLEEAGKNVVSKKCILMYAGQVTGIHAVHKFLVKLFGKY